MDPDDRLHQLGIVVPTFPTPPFQPLLAPVRVDGATAWLSGVGPVGRRGTVGTDLTLDAACEAARETAMLVLRRILDAFGSLDAVESWTFVRGYVRSAPGFERQPEVLNAFTQVIVDIYGLERGLAARSAIGVQELPGGMPIEVEVVLRLAERT